MVGGYLFVRHDGRVEDYWLGRGGGASDFVCFFEYLWDGYSFSGGFFFCILRIY